MQIIYKLNTEDRRVNGTLRPLIYKYFRADFKRNKRNDMTKGMSEFLNTIIETHYNRMSDTERKELLKEYEKIEK